MDLGTQTTLRKVKRTNVNRPDEEKGFVTHIFISVGVLVLGLVRCRHFTIGAVVLTVVIGSAMVCYNH